LAISYAMLAVDFEADHERCTTGPVVEDRGQRTEDQGPSCVSNAFRARKMPRKCVGHLRASGKEVAQI